MEIKRDIVSEDEFESGLRKVLNFGHTVGHALETLSDYTFSHGQAVAIGMVVETRAAVSMGICDMQCLQDISDMLEIYGLPSSVGYSKHDIAKACLSDKKRDGDSITMIFPEKIGKCIIKNVPVSDIESLIRSGLGE